MQNRKRWYIISNRRNIIKGLLSLIFPHRCPICREIIPEDLLVCDSCRYSLRFIEPPFCLRCGRHVDDEEAECCNECEKKSHSYCWGTAVFDYSGGIRKSLSDFKFRGQRENAAYYAFEIAEQREKAIRAFNPMVLVPVPIHRLKRRLRGYNQAELIAEELSRELGIPCINNLLLRKKKTSAQKNLGAKSRKRNLSDAFVCNSEYSNEYIRNHFSRILLVDDIYTTGATVEACAKELKAAGAKEVGFVAVAVGRGS